MIANKGFDIIKCNGFSCVKSSNDYWFTQKTISHIFNMTPQNTTIHLREIYKFKDRNKGWMVFPISKIEGTRMIIRKSKHYNLDNLYDISSRSKRFDEFNEILTAISKRNEVSFSFKVSPVKERNFKEILEKSLKGIEKFNYQHTILKHRVDFFFPRLGLIVEFDENDHRKKILTDVERQGVIESATDYRFIRVNEGKELEGLNSILLFRENHLSVI